MTLEELQNKDREFESNGWVSVDDKLPTEDKVYEVIYHKGSISTTFGKPTRAWFRKGKFPRYDWDYVAYWKEEKPAMWDYPSINRRVL